MQGLIFNALEEFVIKNADLSTWNTILSETDLPSGGIYTAGGRYDDSEMMALAQAVCEKLGVDQATGLEVFGKFLFGFLQTRMASVLEGRKDLFDTLENLDNTVHVNVKRLHPDAYLPFFQFEYLDTNTGYLDYRSNRKLCSLASGLIQGCADHFNSPIHLEHVECMHDGAARCRWHIKRLGD
ncbi:guanylate cyclase [Bermanella marisrubri]|uniref:4-vinyl reductase 4VR domain-containing protein n=1 Tax=Bermanella marisrubri TaxID=207949 RepID=Q1N035_9GAMM|nr:heme NO-binding domain-containing protein [Bermanella marisrubri]EAT11528.1 hypothetical protein RED65_02619 [Oceanobacter sp. RED65] [Bermanella marisrubri]QIZ85007.1 guanylate cyclase [Bermanella marisrubri]